MVAEFSKQIGCSIWLPSDLGLPSNTTTKIPFSYVNYDSGGFTNNLNAGGDYRIDIPVSGIYVICLSLLKHNTTVSDNKWTDDFVTINYRAPATLTSEFYLGRLREPMLDTTSTNWRLGFTMPAWLENGDWLNVYSHMASTTETILLKSRKEFSPRFDVYLLDRLDSPYFISESRVTSAGQSIVSGTDTLVTVFNDESIVAPTQYRFPQRKRWATRQLWDAPNNRFVAPVNGYYLIHAQIKWTNVNFGNHGREVQLRVNGVTVSGSTRRAPTAQNEYGVHNLTEQIYLQRGDYCELWVWQNCGANLSLDGNSFEYANKFSMTLLAAA